MSDCSPFKLAFIGTHGVGKTTLCYGLAARLKRRDVALDLVREVARSCPLPINEATGVAAQSWILHTQIAAELVAAESYEVVICDRSVLDNYVYLLVAAGHQEGLDALVDRWMETYQLLVHVPLVEAPSDDGIRAVDPAFQRAIDDRLMEELAARRLPVLKLDPAARSGWLDALAEKVWERLRPPQLQLL